MKLPKFILDRTDDYLRLSKWRMIGVALFTRAVCYNAEPLILNFRFIPR